MKYINDVVPAYASDIKKRAAKSFGNGDITKQELDEVCDHLDSIVSILGKIKPEPKPVNGKEEKKHGKNSKNGQTSDGQENATS